MKNKGTKQKTKKKGSENAFGCDLIEHLQSSGHDGKCFTLFSLKSNSPLLAVITKLQTDFLPSYLTHTERITFYTKKTRLIDNLLHYCSYYNL